MLISAAVQTVVAVIRGVHHQRVLRGLLVGQLVEPPISSITLTAACLASLSGVGQVSERPL